MRVIAGEHKGRQLRPVPNRLTRPTTDKVKEALFQIIGPFFEGGQALDLFAGSGGLGIEALSRGFDHCVFVDKHPKAIQTIYENLKTLDIEEQTEVFRTDAFRAMKAAGKRGLKFNIIFLDPPYQQVSYEKLVEAIREHDLLKDEGIIICEHDADEHLPDELAGVPLMKHEVYGGTIAISIYR
ncbi:putative rRNA methyltransferase YlbH [Thalassobacillus devorans]|uniref:rRNA methyltransferase YlbH n=1 Tax=Thalassobacillus devorans TaxID=279813 RepID=A0ABQ1NM11_9BACI|nr:16S rRNA (guanine(966)-N(2))-methyltransferase RsmD [Thalassobacillus devorans]NIK27790.1 16S rRNA (guanine966-N2)-methyltransferase [Thalassobacillus devorans]GGC80461.1 putative rRNA methyltransferase YlbH [Thalassobacillus devorans]